MAPISLQRVMTHAFLADPSLISDFPCVFLFSDNQLHANVTVNQNMDIKQLGTTNMEQ
jgi:hypothetical protein